MSLLVSPDDPRQPLPAAFVARRLGVSRQLFKYWCDQGKLQPYDYAPDGRPLYRMIDAAEVERETRNSAKSSRRRPRLAMAGGGS